MQRICYHTMLGGVYLSDAYIKLPEEFGSIQDNSAAVEASARYSASADDRDTIICFLADQEIKDGPRKNQNPVLDLRSSVLQFG